MFVRFDENPAMTLQDIKETKRYGRTDARTDGQRENSIPTTSKVCGGYNKYRLFKILRKQSITHGRTHGRRDGQRENSIPTTNKVCGGV